MLFNGRCVIFHFFYVIVKFCVVFVEEIIFGAIPEKYGCTSTEITKIHTPTRRQQELMSKQGYTVYIFGILSLNLVFN